MTNEYILKNTVGCELYHPDGIVYVPKQSALIAMDKAREDAVKNLQQARVSNSYCCECGIDITNGKYLMICESCRIQI